MPKKFIKRLMPDAHSIKTNKYLQIFGDLLHNANLWHLNRRSIAKAFAVGLFFAFIPVPFQMVLAAGIAILVHANLPISIALVWITNPLTMPAIFYVCYLVGTWIINAPAQEFEFHASWQWILDSLTTIGPAFLLGCLVCAVVFSIIGYVGIHSVWRFSVIKEWNKRKSLRIK
ncbi:MULTISPECIES: DUF2062 domain-containing protein [Colwelliaceae]|uniref:DUF2062 domain-containing protein n=1 Tax=Colwelliaceae TaxID=267889 RepID=UPI0009706368|nr:MULTISPECIES: DUF2062 domain-containing protein [Colwelliaceae]